MNIHLIFMGFIAFLVENGQTRCNSCKENPKVAVAQGLIEGTLKTSYKGRDFSSFEGIPYATPPLGKLRFAEPIEAPKWEGTLFANKSYLCSQWDGTLTVVGSEDCLYLYIYVPGKKVNEHNNLDVVVHLHGGSLIFGSPYDMALPDYIMDKDVVYVTLNYRLGPPGFLSTGDALIPGNNGFKDQVLALKWIKNNIKKFGGNPNSVTITGFSSGGASVHFHYLSPLSKGLFHKGHTLSAVATNPSSLTPNPLGMAKQLARFVNCTTSSTKEMVDCLTVAPIDEFVKANILFEPAIEKGNPRPFLPDDPYRLLYKKDVYDVPWVVSDTIDEMYIALDSVYKNPSQIFDICNNWTEWGREWLDLKDTVDSDKMEYTLNKIKKEYMNDCKDVTEKNGLEKLEKLLTDRHFLLGTDIALRLQAAATKSHVYYYLFTYIPEDRLEFFGPPAASHGVDDKLLYKFRTNPAKLKPNDEKMMFLFADYIADYAKTGIPKIGRNEWKPIDKNGNKPLNVLKINSPDDIKMVKIKELSPLAFWDSLPIKENSHIL